MREQQDTKDTVEATPVITRVAAQAVTRPETHGDALAAQWRASFRGGASFQRVCVATISEKTCTRPRLLVTLFLQLFLTDLSCHSSFVKGGGTIRCAMNTLGPQHLTVRV
eukprot:5944793-Pyramimonas_sp.AAC.1